MKKLFVILIAALCSALIYGQDLNGANSQSKTIDISGLTAINPHPVVFVFIDGERIEVDNIADYNINPKWIESVDVLKDATSKQIYGNKHGVIMIYAKKKYKRKVLKELNKTVTS